MRLKENYQIFSVHGKIKNAYVEEGLIHDLRKIGHFETGDYEPSG